MNKAIFTILLMIVSLNLNAQHLNFMGIPMGSNITIFKKALLSKRNFHADRQQYPDIYYVQGYFNGNKASFSILTTPRTKKVYAVYVSFSDFHCYDYSSPRLKETQENMYKHFKNELTSKYGKGFESSTISGYLIATYWNLKYGNVILSIDQPNDIPSYRRLSVQYIDRATDNLNKKETSSDW